MSKSRVSSLILVVVIAALAILGWYNRYNIHDYIVLRGYTPPVEIEKLANDDTFNDYAKRLFYINKPEISDKTAFNQKCTSREQTIVLGCYNGREIFIFDVTDEKLDGVEQVTAAHEMLHVAYSRLSNDERKKIDDLVDAAYKKINNTRINDLADNYNKQEPGSVPNELHSIIATEIEEIGSELETYYSRYFTDRSKIVAFAKNYEQVFEDLRLQVTNYDADLSLKKAEITNRETSLSEQEMKIKDMNTRMNNLLSSDQTHAYNNLVGEYNSMVNNYNAEVEVIKSLIEQYNNMVIARNAIVVQQQNLAKSIDSRPDAISN